MLAKYSNSLIGVLNIYKKLFANLLRTENIFIVINLTGPLQYLSERKKNCMKGVAYMYHLPKYKTTSNIIISYKKIYRWSKGNNSRRTWGTTEPSYFRLSICVDQKHRMATSPPQDITGEILLCSIFWTNYVYSMVFKNNITAGTISN